MKEVTRKLLNQLVDDHTKAYDHIKKFYEDSMTPEDVITFGTTMDPTEVAAEIIILVSMGELALLSLSLPKHIRETRTFAIACFEQANTALERFSEMYPDSGEIDSFDDTIINTLFDFHRDHGIYTFNMMDVVGNFAVPVTMGFCRKPDEDITNSQPHGDVPSPLRFRILIGTGFLDPMLSYFNYIKLKSSR